MNPSEDEAMGRKETYNENKKCKEYKRIAI